jgi:protein TonB
MTALAVRVPHTVALNWPRVGAWSGSISIHLLIVVLLLIPGAAIQIVRHADIVPIVDVITAPPRAKPVPVMPTPAPLKAHPRATPVAPPVIAVAAPSKLPVTAIDIAPPASSPSADTATQETAPSAIAYGSRTKVAYPVEALRNREQGTVILSVLVGADGTVLSVEIEKSSGSRSLDRAAREAVAKWRFHPATRDRVAHSAWASVPVTFNLSPL